ncbi:MAG: uracil-DNA glycosylase [bacterium]
MDWEWLESRCLRCARCPLAQGRRNVVFGAGVRDAEVMFVGEGPGEVEDATGEPFVGPAGRFLDDMLSLIDLYRDKNYYIANIVKCRPPQNRDPAPAEQDACLDWLWAQLALVRPKIVVCLGRIAATRLIDADFRISKQHGRITERDGIHYMALYHPSALLRDPSKRPGTFVDLKSLQFLMRRLEIKYYE